MSNDKDCQEILIICIQKMMGFYEKKIIPLVDADNSSKSWTNQNLNLSKSIGFSKNNSCSIF